MFLRLTYSIQHILVHHTITIAANLWPPALRRVALSHVIYPHRYCCTYVSIADDLPHTFIYPHFTTHLVMMGPLALYSALSIYIFDAQCMAGMGAGIRT
jgi:hypothetical protein